MQSTLKLELDHEETETLAHLLYLGAAYRLMPNELGNVMGRICDKMGAAATEAAQIDRMNELKRRGLL